VNCEIQREKEQEKRNFVLRASVEANY